MLGEPRRIGLALPAGQRRVQERTNEAVAKQRPRLAFSIGHHGRFLSKAPYRRSRAGGRDPVGWLRDGPEPPPAAGGVLEHTLAQAGALRPPQPPPASNRQRVDADVRRDGGPGRAVDARRRHEPLQLDQGQFLIRQEPGGKTVSTVWHGRQRRRRNAKR